MPIKVLSIRRTSISKQVANCRYLTFSCCSFIVYRIASSYYDQKPPFKQLILVISRFIIRSFNLRVVLHQYFQVVYLFRYLHTQIWFTLIISISRYLVNLWLYEWKMFVRMLMVDGNISKTHRYLLNRVRLHKKAKENKKKNFTLPLRHLPLTLGSNS